MLSRINSYAIYASTTTGATGTLQNVTIRECANLAAQYSYARVTNSLLIAVTNMGSGSFGGAYNGTNSSPASVFQPVGAGYSYLTNNSSFRDSGTTNIDSILLASLQQLTTYAPVQVGHVTTFGNTNLALSPQASRDTDMPDLGYHYSPLDFTFGGVYVTNSTITLQTGTAIGVYSPTNAGSVYGIRLGNGAKLFSDGSPTNLNNIVRYNMVQEQSSSTWNTAPAESVSSESSSVSVTPEARFAFTQWAIPATDTHHFYGYAGTDLIVPFSHCQFIGGKFRSDRPKLNFTNSLFQRVDTIINGASYAISPTIQNCLLYGGALQLTNSQSGTWKVYDTLLHGTTVSQSGTITHDYNGYVTNASGQWLTSGGSQNVWTNTFDYQTGALGQFYQPTNSRFLNLGSTNANYLQLYHFTCTTNNVKETNSYVDIGFHYVATSGGLPVDTDGDGLPDYFEDADGNGTWDSGTETNFADSDTDDDGVNDYTEWIQGRNPLVNGSAADSGNLIKLQVYTPLK